MRSLEDGTWSTKLSISTRENRSQLSLGSANDLITQLEKQVVAQARENAVLRWENATLLRDRPIGARLVQAKYWMARRFPRLVQRASRLRRRLTPGEARRQPSELASSGSSGAAVTKWPFELMGPILVADDGTSADKLASSAMDGSVVRVRPGCGLSRATPVAQVNEPPLRHPAHDSLAHWLVCNASTFGELGSVVVDAGDEVSLSLIRGRMRSGQSLVLTRTSKIASSLVSELGEPENATYSFKHFSSLPVQWLDPTTAEGRPIESVVAVCGWPKISVVMVSFNQAQFLEEGLQSLLDQGYPNLEIVVVDAVSTDGSIAILEAYRSRIDVLIIEKDRGQSDGLNKGFARTTGDILTWVNSDDLLEPGALFRVAQAFMQYGTDMVAGGCRQIGLTRDMLIVNHHTKLPIGMPVRLPLGLIMELEQFWLTASFFYQPEVFFTRDIWLRSGGRLREDLYYVMDYDLWLRMAAAGATIVHIPDFLACSRTHEQQKTVEGMPYMPEIQRLLREYAGRLIS